MSEELRIGDPDILERSVAYSLRIIRLYRELEKDDVGRILGRQLLWSATAIGANAHEAQGAQSKADFIAKMSIAHKEARESAMGIVEEEADESLYWMEPLMKEAHELLAITVASIKTARKTK